MTGSPEEVDDRVVDWMEQEEGLRAIARVDGGIRREPDNHWTTATRLAFRSESTRSRRGMPEIIHRQTALSPDEEVVEIDVGTDRRRNTSLGPGAGLGVAESAAGGGNDLARFAPVAVPVPAEAGGTAFITARARAASIRHRISRALHGIGHPELDRRNRRRRRRYGKDHRRSVSGSRPREPDRRDRPATHLTLLRGSHRRSTAAWRTRMWRTHASPPPYDSVEPVLARYVRDAIHTADRPPHTLAVAG